MFRIACLRIPRFQIAVHQNLEPELKAKALVLLAARSDKEKSSALTGSTLNISRAKIVLCSAEAAKNNVRVGMTFTEARANCSQLIWREYDHRLYQDAQKKLARLLISASPRVSAGATGFFLLDVQGFNKLGGENKFCRDVLKLASRHGYTDGSIGIADCAFAARIASFYKNQRWYAVPAGRDINFLRQMSIDFLPVSDASRNSLIELGIKTIGQFTDREKSLYVERFDADILKAYDLACGFDNSAPTLPSVDKSYQCVLDIGSAMESLKETLFVFKTMFDRLTEQLKNDGLTAEELSVVFFNDDEKFDERTIKLIRPSNNSKFLVDVVKLSLESNALKREFTAIHLFVTRFCRETYEQSRATLEKGRERSYLTLDGSSDLSQSEAAILVLQRFITRLGAEALVYPKPNDQYLPENSGIWVPVINQSQNSTHTTPVNSAYTEPYLHSFSSYRKDDLMPGLVLKRHNPSLPVFVEFDQSKNASSQSYGDTLALVDDFAGETNDFKKPDPAPASITYKGQWYHVSRITCPERISGLWWEKPVRKSYYMALLEKKRDFAFLQNVRNESERQKANVRSMLPPIMTVLLVFDHEESGWFVEGVFD